MAAARSAGFVADRVGCARLAALVSVRDRVTGTPRARRRDAPVRAKRRRLRAQGGADELARLAELRDKGVLTEAEFEQAKAKALA